MRKVNSIIAVCIFICGLVYFLLIFIICSFIILFKLNRKPMGKFIIFIGVDNLYHFHLRARNGKILLQSEAYSTLAMAKKGIRSIRINACTALIKDTTKG